MGDSGFFTGVVGRRESVYGSQKLFIVCVPYYHMFLFDHY